jgi:UDP-N-acetylmuramate dehydrogenase
LIDHKKQLGYHKTVNNRLSLFKNSPFSGEIKPLESMKNHCTFKSGGLAEIFLCPHNIEDIRIARKICTENDIPLFVLGGGANILVSDRGIPGVTLSLQNLNHIEKNRNEIICDSGIPVDDLVKFALSVNLTGLEFLNRLPGSVGGALYMNARCYDSEISHVLSWAEYLDEKNQIKILNCHREEWNYKKSPFQRDDWIILRASFHLSEGKKESMIKKMESIARDRINKGHFKAPSAGSTFKNNREFGKPSGVIIDECGLKGLENGGAAIAPWHGNIFINKNNATSQEISELIYHVQRSVEIKTGFHLEPEVLHVGDWS